MSADDTRAIEALVAAGFDLEEATEFVEDHGAERTMVWLREAMWKAARRPAPMGEA